jgi:hypothetical protein
MRKNLYVSEAATTAAFQAGLQALQREVDAQQIPNAWIVVHSKSNLDGIIADVIGEGNANALAKGQSLRLGKATITAVTAQKLPSAAKGAAILACFISKELLDKVDALRDASVLIVVPWSDTDIEHWVKAHGPDDILGRQQPQSSTLSNPVVERALQSIWARINRSTGIADPRDKDSVIDAFRILRDGKEHVDSDEVRAWLVQKGMKPEYANKITEIAEQPSKFRKSANTARWATDILEQWRGK